MPSPHHPPIHNEDAREGVHPPVKEVRDTYTSLRSRSEYRNVLAERQRIQEGARDTAHGLRAPGDNGAHDGEAPQRRPEVDRRVVHGVHDEELRIRDAAPGHSRALELVYSSAPANPHPKVRGR